MYFETVTHTGNICADEYKGEVLSPTSSRQ